MPKPNDVGVGVAIVLLSEDDKVLLLQRRGSHRQGCWAVPGGWVERSDTTLESAAIREAQEETGISVQRCYFLCHTTEDHPEIGIRSVTMYMISFPGDWTGTATILEPNKCSDMRWFSLVKANALPENMFPGLDEALRIAGQSV